MTRVFVFASDLHLCDRLWAGRPGIFGDAYFSFEQIVDHCICNSLPLILGGDILDKERNFARPIRELCTQLDRMEQCGQPVYFTQGQHERNYDTTWLGIHPWPIHVHKKQFEINGCKLYGLDWCPRGEIATELAAVPPDTDILVCHQVWGDLMGSICRPECTLADVHHVADVLTGDFHVTKIVGGLNAQGRPARLISPGSTCLRSVNEPAEKYFYEVQRENTVDDFNSHYRFVTKRLRTRPIKLYTLATEHDLDALCCGPLLEDIKSMSEGLPENIGKPVVRVKYAATIPDAYLRLTTTVGEAAHLFCDPIADKTRKASQTVDTATDLVAAVTDLLGSDTPELKLGAALLNAENPVTALERQFEQFQSQGVNT